MTCVKKNSVVLVIIASTSVLINTTVRAMTVFFCYYRQSNDRFIKYKEAKNSVLKSLAKYNLR